MDIQTIIELGVAALGGGGIMALFTIPEIKGAKKLDNAERVLAKYDKIIERLEQDNRELKAEVERLSKAVNEYEETIADMKTKMHTMELIGKEDKALRCEKTGCRSRRPPLDKSKLQNIVHNGKSN